MNKRNEYCNFKVLWNFVVNQFGKISVCCICAGQTKSGLWNN